MPGMGLQGRMGCGTEARQGLARKLSTSLL